MKNSFSSRKQNFCFYDVLLLVASSFDAFAASVPFVRRALAEKMRKMI